MTDTDLITSTRERVRTGFNPGGRQVYTVDDEKRMTALADALESTTTRLREAEAVIEEAREANETSWRRADVRAILTRYKTTKTEGNEP